MLKICWVSSSRISGKQFYWNWWLTPTWQILLNLSATKVKLQKTSGCRWRSQQTLSWSPCNAFTGKCLSSSSLFAAWSQKQETQHLSYPLNLNGKILSSLFFLWFLYGLFWFTLGVFFSSLIKKEFKWTFVVAKSLLS